MDAYGILVIILSITLAIALVIAIIGGIMMVLILKQLRRIVDKASIVVDNVEEASEFFKNTTMTTATVKLFSSMAQLFKKSKNGKGD